MARYMSLCFASIPLVHLFLYVFIDVVNLRLKLLPSLLWRKVTKVLRIRTLRGDREGDRQTLKTQHFTLRICRYIKKYMHMYKWDGSNQATSNHINRLIKILLLLSSGWLADFGNEPISFQLKCSWKINQMSYLNLRSMIN